MKGIFSSPALVVRDAQKEAFSFPFPYPIPEFFPSSRHHRLRQKAVRVNDELSSIIMYYEAECSSLTNECVRRLREMRYMYHEKDRWIDR